MMSKAYTVVGLVALLVLLGIATGAAEPTLRGYSGLLLAPTSDALNRNEYNVSINSTELSGFDDRAYTLNFGLEDDIEGGLLWLHPNRGSTETIINLKHRFARGDSRRASLAVGVTDLTGELDTSVYVVATKEFGRPAGHIGRRPVHMLRVHAGVGSGMLDDFFFGAEAQLGRYMTLMAEHVNNQINVGARLHPWPHLTVDAGWLDMDNLAVGLSYNYPLQRAKALKPIASEPSRPKLASAPTPAQPTATARPEEAEAQFIIASVPEAAARKELKPATKPTPPPQPQVAQHHEPATTPQADTVPEVTPAVEAGELRGGVEMSKPFVEIPLRGFSPEVGFGHIFVPVRAVAEWLGFNVAAQFTAQGLQVTVFAGVQAAEFYVGDNQVNVNGEPAELTTPTYLQNNTVTMVPVEFFALLGVPTDTDAEAGRALLERHDVVGGIFISK